MFSAILYQLSFGKVMLSFVSVHQSVIPGREGGGQWKCDYSSWCTGPHCTGLAPYPPDIRHGTPSPPASYIWWPFLETCSNLFTWGSPPHTHIWGPPIGWMHVLLASGRYASHWNAFLSTMKMRSICCLCFLRIRVASKCEHFWYGKGDLLFSMLCFAMPWHLIYAQHMSTVTKSKARAYIFLWFKFSLNTL